MAQDNVFTLVGAESSIFDLHSQENQLIVPDSFTTSNSTSQLATSTAYYSSLNVTSPITLLSILAMDNIFNIGYLFDPNSFSNFASYTVNKMRLLFYLVWPTETMFPSIDKVPRFVAEVSCGPEQDLSYTLSIRSLLVASAVFTRQ